MVLFRDFSSSIRNIVAVGIVLFTKPDKVFPAPISIKILTPAFARVRNEAENKTGEISC